MKTTLIQLIAMLPSLLGNNFRLPTYIVPSNYNITLKPYLLAEDGIKQFRFDGETFIKIKNKKANLQQIILNAKSLNDMRFELYETDNPESTIKIDSWNINNSKGELTLNLSTDLTVDISYTLHFLYTGVVGNDMHGVYRSHYVDDNNNTKWLAATQFQKSHARRAFPCFDEPSFKATFDLTLIYHKQYNSVSNSRIIHTEKIDNDYWKNVYATTPIMSTYLLAFLISDFAERGDGEFFVTARPQMYLQTKYAFNVGPKILAAFDKYTQLPYYEQGIDKMHLAAIPDFANAAMENWGLLTFRTSYLLYDEGTTLLLEKQKMLVTIAHEITHQWFGNLVTCDWWGYTWLNEGFANYFGYHMTALVYPEWELEKQFVVLEMQNVFAKDMTDKTNRLNEETSNGDDMFNRISYSKGGSVIRMIKHAIGEENFQRSLRSYLKEYQYKTVAPKNIFDHWKANWPANSLAYADGVFTSFTEQLGYPVVYIELASDSKSMTIKQKRFLADRDNGSNASLLYTIPLSYTTNLDNNFDNTAPKLYLEAKADKVTVTFPKAVEWVVGNIQSTGYYRVNYSTPLWHKIRNALHAANWSGIHELNRAQYINDLSVLAIAEDVTYKMYLHCLDYLQTELNYLPWSAAFNAFEFLEAQLGVENENFGKYITHLARKAYDKLGFEETEKDTPMEIYTRIDIISWICKYGHADCVQKSLKLLRNLNTTDVPVNIRGVVYCSAMRNANENDFNILYDKMKIETNPTELSLIIKNLGCVREQKLVERYFNIIISDEISFEDKSNGLLALCTKNAENLSPVFTLVTKNFGTLAKSMGSKSSVASIINKMASFITTKEQLTKLKKFIDNKDSSGNALKIALRVARDNIAWGDRHLDVIKQFLKDFVQKLSDKAV